MNAKSRSVLITGFPGSGKNKLLDSLELFATQDGFHIVKTSNLCQPISVKNNTFNKDFQWWQESISSRTKTLTSKYLHVLISPCFLSMREASVFDAVICLHVEAEEQWKRLRERGLSDEVIEDMIKSQTPLSVLNEKGAYILNTTGMVEGGEVYKEHITSIWEHIKGPVIIYGPTPKATTEALV